MDTIYVSINYSRAFNVGTSIRFPTKPTKTHELLKTEPKLNLDAAPIFLNNESSCLIR